MERNIEYKQKYFKYKQKYLALQREIQKGGRMVNVKVHSENENDDIIELENLDSSMTIDNVRTALINRIKEGELNIFGEEDEDGKSEEEYLLYLKNKDNSSIIFKDQTIDNVISDSENKELNLLMKFDIDGSRFYNKSAINIRIYNKSNILLRTVIFNPNFPITQFKKDYKLENFGLAIRGSLIGEIPEEGKIPLTKFFDGIDDPYKNGLDLIIVSKYNTYVNVIVKPNLSSSDFKTIKLGNQSINMSINSLYNILRQTNKGNFVLSYSQNGDIIKEEKTIFTSSEDDYDNGDDVIFFIRKK